MSTHQYLYRKSKTTNKYLPPLSDWKGFECEFWKGLGMLQGFRCAFESVLAFLGLGLLKLIYSCLPLPSYPNMVKKMHTIEYYMKNSIKHLQPASDFLTFYVQWDKAFTKLSLINRNIQGIIYNCSKRSNSNSNGTQKCLYTVCCARPMEDIS